MKQITIIVLAFVLTSASVRAQQSKVLGFDVTSLTFAVESPPVNADLHFCLDLADWDWHSFPVDSGQRCTTATNIYDLTAVDWAAFPNRGSGVFLRIVCSSNDIPNTVTTNRVVFVNDSSTTVSNIVLGVRNWVGDLVQVTNVTQVLPVARTGQFDFILHDPNGAMSPSWGVFEGSYMQASSEKPLGFEWFWWGPSLAERTVRFDDAGFSVE